uniref:Uncharacterized protein n=1 Tax=Tetradesmus obliquus TaxID=3088 RepID=A0A383VRL2_TETOB|eukprot:jgi/Sobl393_1/18291/SZX77888.1
MQGILSTSNPLFHVNTGNDFQQGPLSPPSPTREYPIAQTEQQQGHSAITSQQPQQQQQQPRKQPAPQWGGEDAPTRRQCAWACCKAVPWIPLLCTMLTAGALIVWSVHSDRVTASLLSVLERMRAPESIAAGVNGFVKMLKVVLLAAVSAVVGLLLLLFIYRQQQVLQKRRALRYADWPHGCRVHAYVSITAALLLLLWLISAGLACVLCFAATSGGVALVGDMAASRAFRHAVLNNVTTTHVNVNETVTRLTEASAEFKRRMAETPAQLRLTPWFGGLEKGIGRLLDNAVQDISASSYCPAYCLDMSPVASLMPWVNSTSMNTCVCGQQTLFELQQQFSRTFKDALAACVALAVLLLSASWLLVYGVGSCASARRDHQAARLSFENEQQTAHQRDHRVRNWMRAAPQHTYSPYPATAGEYYRGSGGGVGGGSRMAERSSGGGFDVGGDQQRQVQLMAPELRSSLSPSPRKASCKSKEDWPSATAAADSRLVGDVEQPAVRGSDQQPGISAGLQGGANETLRSSVASGTSQQQQQQQRHVQLQPPRRRWNDSWRR